MCVCIYISVRAAYISLVHRFTVFSCYFLFSLTHWLPVDLEPPECNIGLMDYHWPDKCTHSLLCRAEEVGWAANSFLKKQPLLNLQLEDRPDWGIFSHLLFFFFFFFLAWTKQMTFKSLFCTGAFTKQVVFFWIGPWLTTYPLNHIVNCVSDAIQGILIP